VEIKVFWCKVNKYYTDKWMNSEYLKNKKWYFVATCAVTDKAKQKWIKFVKDILKKVKSDEKIYITWCSAIKDGKAQDNFFEIYSELKEYKNIIEILDEDPESPQSQPFPPREKGVDQIKFPSTFGRGLGWRLPNSLYTKKFVLIQWWCDSFCSFCLTVIKRWRHYSRIKEDILTEIVKFEKSWWKEVVLTWINLWAWWLKNTNEIWKSRLAEILQYILDNSNIKRIRISSLWPEFVDEKCLEIFKNTRIYPHFHYSVQSWSSKILKSMKRHYDWEYIKKILLKTKNLKRDDGIDISLWADIIVWFPWETDEDFLYTYNLVKEVWIQKIHAFPFSWHKIWETVPAWNYSDQIDDKIKKQRMQILTKLSDSIRKQFIKSQTWKTLEVLIESVRNWNWKWWTQNYIEANQDNFEILEGEIKRNEVVVGRLK